MSAVASQRGRGGGAVKHPLFARFLEWRNRAPQADEVALRRELVAGLSGRVLEIGPGNGLNFAHYPLDVGLLVGVEPEPYLRSRAIEAARRAPVPTLVIGGLAGELPFADSSFDAAVVSGVLCSVPDVQGALADLARVLRPEAELRFYEHVRAASPLRGRFQDLADLLWPRLMGGCHPNRETAAAIERAGYGRLSFREFMFPPGSRLCPVGPRILGRARVPPKSTSSG